MYSADNSRIYQTETRTARESLLERITETCKTYVKSSRRALRINCLSTYTVDVNEKTNDNLPEIAAIIVNTLEEPGHRLSFSEIKETLKNSGMNSIDQLFSYETLKSKSQE